MANPSDGDRVRVAGGWQAWRAGVLIRTEWTELAPGVSVPIGLVVWEDRPHDDASGIPLFSLERIDPEEGE